MATTAPALPRRALQSFDRLPFAREATALVAVLLVMQFFPGGVPGSVYVLGTTNAAPLVLTAIGIVLVYRSNRFINFSQVALASSAGTLFYGLARGEIALRELHQYCPACVGERPGATALAINFWLAAVVAVLAAAALNYAVYVLVIRRFGKSPVLVVTIVTIFLAQALSGSNEKLSSQLVPNDQVMAGVLPISLHVPLSLNATIAGVPLQAADFLLIVAAIIAIVGIAQYLRRSETGNAMRAASENPGRASTLGVDVGAVTGRVWAISGLLAGVVGVLQGFDLASAPSSSSQSTQAAGIPVDTLIIVLAVVVVARFTSTWMAGLAALVLSILQTGVQFSFSSLDPLNAAYVFIIGGLLLLQRERGGRAEREDQSGLELTRELRGIPSELSGLEVVRRYRRIGFIAAGVALLAMPFVLSVAGTSLFSDAMLTAIVGLSLLVLTGWGGQVSLGQFGFAAIGAWAAAASGLPYVLALVLAGIVGAVSAIIVGLPALKLKGLTLAVSTLAFAISASALFVEPRYLGRYLPSTLRAPGAFGLSLSNERVTYYVALLVALGFCAVVVGLRRTRTGRALIAVKVNEAAGQSFGISPLRARLTAFSISGFMAAVAGAMLAFHIGRVAPDTFSPDQSLTVFLFVVIGGLGGLAGPLLGVGFYALITFFFASNPIIEYSASGVGALLLLVVAPGGLAQLVYSARDAMLRRVAYRLRIPVPSLMGEKRAGLAADKVHLDEKRVGPPKPGAKRPTRFKPAGQWAFDRLGSADENETKERVGVR